MDERAERGKRSEEIAVGFLKEQGFKVLARNYRCALGEIDIVAKDGKTIVFVEVRSRSSTAFGFPQESVDRTKRRKVIRLAQWYLKQQRLEREPARFDVIAVTWRDDEPETTWIPNAFDARG